MAIVIKPEDTIETTLEKINQEIDSRRNYGVRREELPSTRKVTRCIWSNGTASWMCGLPDTRRVCPGASAEFKRELTDIQAKQDSCRFPRGEEEWNQFQKESREFSEKYDREKPSCRQIVSRVQCLDANEIVIVGMNREKARDLAPLFAELPLYSGSFEARMGGKFTLKGIEIPPAIARQRPDDLDRETIKALVEKAREMTEV